jgi:hypothetical protein
LANEYSTTRYGLAFSYEKDRSCMGNEVVSNTDILPDTVMMMMMIDYKSIIISYDQIKYCN